jgi:hypothetical protein
MFLASAYPLNERSGVNLKGEVNMANTTEYEEEVDFAADEDEDGIVSSSSSSSSDPSAEDGESTIDYNLYRRFLEVQK